MFTIFTKPNCSHCTSAKEALKIKGLSYVEIFHDTPEKLEGFINMGYRTFPQVFEGKKHIGGNTELQMYLMENY